VPSSQVNHRQPSSPEASIATLTELEALGSFDPRPSYLEDLLAAYFSPRYLWRRNKALDLKGVTAIYKTSLKSVWIYKQ
jgi:hypothetical protein